MKESSRAERKVMKLRVEWTKLAKQLAWAKSFGLAVTELARKAPPLLRSFEKLR